MSKEIKQCVDIKEIFVVICPSKKGKKTEQQRRIWRGDGYQTTTQNSMLNILFHSGTEMPLTGKEKAFKH